jgi:hypothetical protein
MNSVVQAINPNTYSIQGSTSSASLNIERLGNNCFL